MSAVLTHDEIYRLPKIDLHRHLDGAVRPELLLRLAKELGIKLPTYDLEELVKLYQITEPGMSIDQIFQRFAWPIAVMRTPYGLFTAAYEQVLDMARENIIYSEVQLAPGYHSIYTAPWYSAEMYEQNLFPPMTLDQVAEAVLAGFDQGMKETGVVVNTNFCIPRESLDVWGPDSVENYLNLCFRFQTDGVVAMGLACDEYKYSPDPYIEYFRRLKGSRIRGNPHGGEMGPDQQRLQNIMTCFFGLGAHGITHALPIHQNKFLMYMASKTNVRIERTPLSPVPGCSLADGHLDVLLKYKVPVVITSDDPVLMQASLTDNWVAVLNYHQFGEEQFWQMTANAVNTAFYRDQAQKTLVQDMFVKQGLSPSLLK